MIRNALSRRELLTRCGVGMGMLGRHLAPILAGSGELDVAAEEVRIRHAHRSLAAVDLERPVAVASDVEAHGDGHRGPRGELEDAGGMGLDERWLVLLLEEAGYAGLPHPIVETAAVAMPLVADRVEANALVTTALSTARGPRSARSQSF